MDKHLNNRKGLSWDELLQHSQIVSIQNDSIEIKQGNLKAILDTVATSDKFYADHPVAILAVLGPRFSGKSFLTNFLIQYFNFGEEGGWMSDIIRKSENGMPMMERGFAWNSVAHSNFYQPSLNSDASASGVYLWPEPFLVRKCSGKKVVVWIMHLYCPKGETEENVRKLEEVLLMMCSRIMEIKWNSEKLGLLEPPEMDASLEDDLCKSAFFLIRSYADKKTKMLSDDKAKEALIQLLNDPAKQSRYKECLDEFQHVNLGWIKDSKESPQNHEGVLNVSIMKTMFPVIKRVVEAITDETEIEGKISAGEETVTLDSMAEFIVNAVKKLGGKVEETTQPVFNSNNDEVLNAENEFYQLTPVTSTTNSNMEETLEQENKHEKCEIEEEAFEAFTPIEILMESLKSEEIQETPPIQHNVPFDSLVTDITPTCCSQTQLRPETELQLSDAISINSSEDQNEACNNQEIGIPESKEKVSSTSFQDSNDTSMELDESWVLLPNLNDESEQQPIIQKALVKSIVKEEDEKMEVGFDPLLNEAMEELQIDKDNHKSIYSESDKINMTHEEGKNMRMECSKVTMPPMQYSTFQNAEHWINSNFNRFAAETGIKIYAHILKQLIADHQQNAVVPNAEFLSDFLDRVDGQCQTETMSILERISEQLRNFNRAIQSQFELHVSFTQDELQQVAENEFSKMTSEITQGNIFEMVKRAGERIMDFYVRDNAVIAETERNLRSSVASQLTTTYNEQIKRYLMNGPYSSESFQCIHGRLVDMLVNTFKTSCIPANEDSFIMEDIDNFKGTLHALFGFYKKQNDEMAQEQNKAMNENNAETINEVGNLDDDQPNKVCTCDENLQQIPEDKEQVGTLWDSPNYSAAEEPSCVLEDRALALVKADLFQKCQQMIQMINNNQFKIRSQLVKDKVLEQISDAEKIGKEQNIELKHIEIQMQKLEKLCQKYE